MITTNNSTTGAWVAYAGLLVSALAHFGWIVDQNTAITIIAGIVAFGGMIYQHYKTNSVITAAKAGAIK